MSKAKKVLNEMIAQLESKLDEAREAFDREPHPPAQLEISFKISELTARLDILMRFKSTMGWD